MTGGSLFYVEKWPPVIFPRRIMTPSRRIMSPTRRINTRGVFIQRVGYKKMTPIEKWPHILLWCQRSRTPLIAPAKQNATWGSLCPSSVCPSGTLLVWTFICGMWIHCDKTFPMVPYILSTWSWPLTYISKTLTLTFNSLTHNLPTIRHRAFILSVCAPTVTPRPFWW